MSPFSPTFLHRLFVLFAVANLKGVAFIFLGTTALILLQSFDVRYANWIEPIWGRVPWALTLGFAVTFLIFWPLWIARINQEAKKQGWSLVQYVLSADYLRLLNEHSKALK